MQAANENGNNGLSTNAGESGGEKQGQDNLWEKKRKHPVRLSGLQPDPHEKRFCIQEHPSPFG